MDKRASKHISARQNPRDGVSSPPPIKNSHTMSRRMAMRRLRITIAALISVFIVLIGILGAVYIHNVFADKEHLDSTNTGITSDETPAVVTITPTKPAENTTGYETTSEPSQTTDIVPTVSVISPSSTPTPTPTQIQGGNIDLSSIDLTGYIVVLDPGHQQHANSEQEPVSPGSTETKDKVSAGTTGVATGRSEYEVNLEIALLMEDYLESLGCTVYLTRTENDVNISNVERAEYAVSSGADVYIRLHCDGSSNPATRGIGVFVADSGTYVSSLVGWGDILGNSLAQTTGSVYRGCVATDTYSGLNWATDIPSFLLEMGFMSNSTDDTLLSDPAYQEELCEGVALFVSQMPK